MSTIEPPPRPDSASAVPTRRRRGSLTRIEPCLIGRELLVWRSLAATLLCLLAAGALLGASFASMCAFLLLGPVLLMATNRAPWWVRRQV
jgi:hypothetical protein